MTTQDGYDWPSGCTDERWPLDTYLPAAAYWREQLRDDEQLREGAKERVNG
jgi:hypothetical protein